MTIAILSSNGSDSGLLPDAPSPQLNQCWFIVYETPGSTFRWRYRKNPFVNIVYKMVIILFMLQCLEQIYFHTHVDRETFPSMFLQVKIIWNCSCRSRTNSVSSGRVALNDPWSNVLSMFVPQEKRGRIWWILVINFLWYINSRLYEHLLKFSGWCCFNIQTLF